MIQPAHVFPIRIPPLREHRTEDIPFLVRHFTRKFARRMEQQIETVPSSAMKKLVACHWPCNVRELENFIERAVILTRRKRPERSVIRIGDRGRARAAACHHA